MSMKSITTGSSVLTRTLAFVLVIATGAIVATAGSAKPTARSGALRVTKECSQYLGQVGQFCTITTSNVPFIKPGMKVVYLEALDLESGTLEGDMALGAGQGTALGRVVLDLGKESGRVSFSVGTGRFDNFRARAVVSLLDKEKDLWGWDGRYSFGRSDDDD
jgi:hypothetical protein